MVPPPLKGGLTALLSGNGDESGIKDGDQHEDDWKKDYSHHGFSAYLAVAADYRHKGEEKSDKQRSVITEIDFCRFKIEDQETDQCCCEHTAHHKQGGIPVDKEVVSEKARGNDGDPAGEAVHIIDEIEGIGNTYKPEKGDQQIETGPGKTGSDPKGEGDQDNEDLPDKLLIGLEFEDIIYQPQQKHGKCAPQRNEKRVSGNRGLSRKGEKEKPH